MPKILDNFIERELSYKVRGCFYDVRNKYSSHHQERVYDRALGEQFDLKGIKHISQSRINIYSLDTGKKIAIYIPDRLVENKIIVEVKAKPFTTKEDQKQVIEYLKTSKYEVAYLVNFGERNFKPRRFIYTNDRKHFIGLLKDNNGSVHP